ncbi:uncharacterized protein [Nicotiana tomentosiformis]|uniref:uncharacterized protein n=1 Tax=Nicotiana tomentosiformis TaxID=4098 RepID=UPI00388C359E
MGSLAFTPTEERHLAMNVRVLDSRFERLDISEHSGVVAGVVARSSLFERIKVHLCDDFHLLVLRDTVLRCGVKEVVLSDGGVLQHHGQIGVSSVDGLREFILEEAHRLQYSIHSSDTDLYHSLKQHYR